MHANVEVITNPRAWAVRVVQWNPARNGIKYAVHGLAGARSRWLDLRTDGPEVSNIFAASSPKAGSQWMKALFHHPVVRAHTGLFTLPQLDYQATPERVFPASTFVPGLYCSHDEYLRMPKLRRHKVVYMFRDPRDVIVSGYHAAVQTHRKLNDPEIEAYRDRLRAMPMDDAITDIIHASAERLHEAASWVGADDGTVATFRLENVAADPRHEVDRILRHCGVELAPEELESVLTDVSRGALQAKDLAARKAGSESHYRLSRTTFRDVFKPEHYAAMDEVAPGIVTRMGYPDHNEQPEGLHQPSSENDKGLTRQRT